MDELSLPLVSLLAAFVKSHVYSSKERVKIIGKIDMTVEIPCLFVLSASHSLVRNGEPYQTLENHNSLLEKHFDRICNP